MSKRFGKNSKIYKVINIISKIISIIFGISIVAMAMFIVILNIFPTKYLIIGGIIFAIIIFIMSFILISKKTKLKLRIIFSILALLITSGIIFGMVSGINTLDFLDKVVAKNYKTERYYVIVRKDSSYTNINDLSGVNVYLYDNGSKAIEEVITNITTITNSTITKSNELFSITNDLLEKRIEALVIESSFKEILDEENEVFKDNTKIIYTVTTKVEVEKTTKEVGITTEPFTLLITGMDTYGSITKTSRSDVNIVATINPKTKQVLLTSIPRDFYVQLHGTRGYKDKLTHAGIYGVNMSVKTVEDLLDMDINYYAKINFFSLIRIVDVLDGIDVYSKYSFSVGAHHYEKGINHMIGEKALVFARERHNVPGGDRARGENQEAVIEAITKKASSPQILAKYNTILNTLNGTFETNMSTINIKKLVKMQLNDMATWKIVSSNLNGTDSHNYTYSLGKQLLYVMEPKQSTIDKAKAMIEKVKNGEIITAE